MKVKRLNLSNRKGIQAAFLVSQLVKRDLKIRYAGSTFGPAWALFSPLAWVLIYCFVFSVVLKVPLVGERHGINFPEYLLAAFLPWLAIQEGISRSATCLTDNAQMIKKSVFLRESLVASVVLSAVANELIAFFLYGIYLAFRGHLSVSWMLLLVPLLALQILMTYGLGCILAGVNVFVRDTAQAVILGLAMLSFLTPIFYSVSMVPARFRWVIEANPFAHLVEAFRDVFFRQRFPGMASALYLVIFAVSAGILGSRLFVKAEPHFADLL